MAIGACVSAQLLATQNSTTTETNEYLVPIITTVVTGSRRRMTLMECPVDTCAMLDLAKVKELFTFQSCDC